MTGNHRGAKDKAPAQDLSLATTLPPTFTKAPSRDLDSPGQDSGYCDDCQRSSGVQAWRRPAEGPSGPRGTEEQPQPPAGVCLLWTTPGSEQTRRQVRPLPFEKGKKPSSLKPSDISSETSTEALCRLGQPQRLRSPPMSRGATGRGGGVLRHWAHPHRPLATGQRRLSPRALPRGPTHLQEGSWSSPPSAGPRLPLQAPALCRPPPPLCRPSLPPSAGPRPPLQAPRPPSAGPASLCRPPLSSRPSASSSAA